MPPLLRIVRRGQEIVAATFAARHADPYDAHMRKSHATLLMFVTTAAYWIIGPLLAAYDCYHLSDALTAGRELYLAAAFRAMGLTALPWAAAMILFAGLWAICPADKSRSPFEP